MQLKHVETKQALVCTCSSDAAHCIGLAQHMIHCRVLVKSWHQKPQSSTRHAEHHPESIRHVHLHPACTSESKLMTSKLEPVSHRFGGLGGWIN